MDLKKTKVKLPLSAQNQWEKSHGDKINWIPLKQIKWFYDLIGKATAWENTLKLWIENMFVFQPNRNWNVGEKLFSFYPICAHS